MGIDENRPGSMGADGAMREINIGDNFLLRGSCDSFSGEVVGIDKESGSCDVKLTDPRVLACGNVYTIDHNVLIHYEWDWDKQRWS